MLDILNNPGNIGILDVEVPILDMSLFHGAAHNLDLIVGRAPNPPEIIECAPNPAEIIFADGLTAIRFNSGFEELESIFNPESLDTPPLDGKPGPA